MPSSKVWRSEMALSLTAPAAFLSAAISYTECSSRSRTLYMLMMAVIAAGTASTATPASLPPPPTGRTARGGAETAAAGGAAGGSGAPPPRCAGSGGITRAPPAPLAGGGGGAAAAPPLGWRSRNCSFSIMSSCALLRFLKPSSTELSTGSDCAVGASRIDERLRSARSRRTAAAVASRSARIYGSPARRP